MRKYRMFFSVLTCALLMQAIPVVTQNISAEAADCGSGNVTIDNKSFKAATGKAYNITGDIQISVAPVVQNQQKGNNRAAPPPAFAGPAIAAWIMSQLTGKNALAIAQCIISTIMGSN